MKLLIAWAILAIAAWAYNQSEESYLMKIRNEKRAEKRNN